MSELTEMISGENVLSRSELVLVHFCKGLGFHSKAGSDFLSSLVVACFNPASCAWTFAFPSC